MNLFIAMIFLISLKTVSRMFSIIPFLLTFLLFQVFNASSIYEGRFNFIAAPSPEQEEAHRSLCKCKRDFT